MLTSLLRHTLAQWDTLAAWLLAHPRRVVLALMLLGGGLVTSTYSHFNLTWDEPEHVAAGLALLDRNEFIYDIQHPTLARMAMALGPWLAGAHAFAEPGPSGEQAGRDLFYQTGHYELYLTLARLGMVPFYLLLLWTVWHWTHTRYGRAEGLLATLLLVATPVIMGHAGVAALDLPGTATCILALCCLLSWFAQQTWRHALSAGVACALATATKLSALPFMLLVSLVWLGCWGWTHYQRGTRPPWLSVCLQGITLILVMITVVIFTYGWRFRYIVSDQYPYNTALSFVFGRSGFWHDLAHGIARHVPLPEGAERFVWSIEALLMHNNEGHHSYLLGELSNRGFLEFYPIALAVKTPIPLLLLGIGGLIFLLRTCRQQWHLAAPATAFLVILLFCMFYSHINIGVRHVMVLYPLLCIAASVWLVHLWRRVATLRWALHWRTGLLALCVWQTSALAYVHPDYLAYFNLIAGAHPEKILIDSDLDWGQDVKRLRTRLNELQVTRFAFVYRGSLDVLGERLPGVWMAQPNEPTTGWVAASIFARDTVDEGKAYAWLKAYQPRERIGKSIDLYYIPSTPSQNAR